MGCGVGGQVGLGRGRVCGSDVLVVQEEEGGVRRCRQVQAGAGRCREMCGSDVGC